MATSQNFTADDVILKPVTDHSEVPPLVELCMRALDSDPMKEWVELYTEHSERQSTLEALNDAIDDPTYTVVKAVVPPQTPGGEEILVGFARWLTGYISLDKVDPFAPKGQQAIVEKNAPNDVHDPTSNITEEIRDKIEESWPWHMKSKYKGDEVRIRRLKFGESVFVDSRNYYIMAIRGKKHIYIRHIMVEPQYQRRGIAAKLLKHITDEADRQKIVCWLFSRPAGEKLYLRKGFKSTHTTSMDDGDFYCPPAQCMLRQAQPIST